MKLTSAIVERMSYAKQGKAADYRWDSEVRGLAVRVYPSGRRTYVCTYRSDNGTKRFHKLGDAALLRLPHARRLARECLSKVLNGNDPQRDRIVRRGTLTVAQLCDRYLTQHAEARKRASSIKQDKRMIETRIIPRLGSMKLDDVTRADVHSIHYSLRKTPFEANRVLTLLSKMMNLAERWGLRPDATNPCRHVERYREPKRERFLSDTEFSRLGACLIAAERKRTESEAAVAAIRLLIFTGCRLTEILTLKWDDVDFDKSVLLLPTSKTGARPVLLGPAAKQVLADLKRVDGNPHVLCGAKPGEHWKNLHRAWNRIRRAAGLSDVRLHDLRHSFASVGVGIGLSLPIIGKLLGHSQAATTQRYAHLADDPVRRAVEAISSRVEAAMSAAPSGQVIELRRGRTVVGKRGSQPEGGGRIAGD